MSRLAGSLALALSFALMAVGVYLALDRSQRIGNAGHAATTGTRAHVLPGTLYVAQQGRLYSYRAGVFKQLTPADGWTQPVLTPDGTGLVAVKRAFNHSDVYLLGLDGSIRTQLTRNASSVVELNHWAFYPRFSADGSSIFYSYDPKDPYNNFRVDLAVYAMPATGPGPGRQWSRPNEYTGGDIDALALKGGGLLYAKYSIDEQGVAQSQLWIQARALSTGIGLTPPGDDCGQPALSAEGTRVAMVCRKADGSTTLEVAPLDAANFALGARTILFGDQQVSSPAFSPDGSTIAYFAPARAGGPLQLWVTPAAAAAAPSPSPSGPAPPGPAVTRTRVTADLAFDATSPVAWSK